jgi:steroid delta-isomerase-like uncharacterized protein
VAQWGPDWQDRLPRAFNAYTEGFSGIQITVQEMVAEGDKVATWFTVHGTHLGTFAGVPATGKTIEWSVVDLYTVVNGKIVACTRRGRSLKDLLLKSSER